MALPIIFLSPISCWPSKKDQEVNFCFAFFQLCCFVNFWSSGKSFFLGVVLESAANLKLRPLCHLSYTSQRN